MFLKEVFNLFWQATRTYFLERNSSTADSPLEAQFPQLLPDDRRLSFRLWLKPGCWTREMAHVRFEPTRATLTGRKERSSFVYRATLDCKTATAATALRRLGPNTLEELVLLTHDTPTTESLTAFFRAAAECANKNYLTQISVGDYSTPSQHQRPVNAKGPYRGDGMDPLLFDQCLMFAPLLWGLWNLDTLVIELIDVLSFTDAFVERLVDACPNLVTLTLWGPPLEKRIAPLDRASSITLQSLRTLARKTPKLRELRIELDATQRLAFDNSNDLPSIGLLQIGVGMSPIDTPERVAFFLESIFPDLEVLEYTDVWPGRYGVDPTEVDRVAGWETVEKHLGLWPFQIEEEANNTETGSTSEETLGPQE